MRGEGCILGGVFIPCPSASKIIKLKLSLSFSPAPHQQAQHRLVFISRQNTGKSEAWGRGEGGRRGVHTWVRSACGGGDSPMLGGDESPMRGRGKRRGRHSSHGRGERQGRRSCCGRGERPRQHHRRLLPLLAHAPALAPAVARHHLVGRPRKTPAATWSEENANCC